MRVEIVLYDGFDDLDAIGPYEVLRRAEGAALGLEVRLVTREPVEQVTSRYGLGVVPQGVLGGGADLVIVPGGGWGEREEVGAWGEIQRGVLPRTLAAAHRRGAGMAAVCTGAMLLSAGGITRGRPATTHHAALVSLREQGAEIIEARVVDDEDLVTCGGVTAGIDMALWLLERQFGSDQADAIADSIEHQRRGPVYRGGSIGQVCEK